MCVCDCEVTVKPRKVAREVESLRERERQVLRIRHAVQRDRERKGEVYILGGKRALFCGVRGRKCGVEKGSVLSRCVTCVTDWTC